MKCWKEEQNNERGKICYLAKSSIIMGQKIVIHGSDNNLIITLTMWAVIRDWTKRLSNIAGQTNHYRHNHHRSQVKISQGFHPFFSKFDGVIVPLFIGVPYEEAGLIDVFHVIKGTNQIYQHDLSAWTTKQAGVELLFSFFLHAGRWTNIFL